MRDTNVAELLSRCRERSKLSQQELADKLFVDQAIVSKVENGKINPSYVLVKAWAAATDGNDMLGMDFVGNSGWLKLKNYEEKFQMIKDLVLYFKGPDRRRAASKK